MNQNRSLLPLTLIIIVGGLGLFAPTAAAPAVGGAINPGDTAWMLTASCLVLLMTPGLSFFYGGMVSEKNVVSTMFQSFVAMGLISILWVICGFSLAFGESIGGIVGNPMTFFMFKGVTGATHTGLSPTIPLVLFALFQLKFAIITPALITGSFAERVRFSSYCLFICLFSIFIYSPIAHLTWHPEGLFRVWGVLDFAGGTVVHMTAGFAALAGAFVLGRRHSHIEKEETVPHNIPYVILGTGMLWFGWFGFNAGSAVAANEGAASAFLATNTASAAAMLTWIALDIMRGRRPSCVGACIAAVVGLVAITPASGFVSVGASIVIGIVSSIASNIAVTMRARSNLDDTLDVFPCHGVGGAVGMLCTGLFAQTGGLFTTGESQLLIMQILAMAAVGAYSFIMGYILYKITDVILPLRVDEKEERQGLDLSQHGENGMPMFFKGPEYNDARPTVQ